MTNLQLTTATFIVAVTFAIATAANAGMMDTRYESRVDRTYDDYSATHKDINSRAMDTRTHNNVPMEVPADEQVLVQRPAPMVTPYNPYYTADDYNRIENNAVNIR